MKLREKTAQAAVAFFHLATPLRRRLMRGSPTALLIGALLIGATPAAQAQVRAGAASERFTLPRGVPLAGFSRRGGEPSRGLHDPVGVRALFVEDGRTQAALVSCDLLIIDEPLFDAVRSSLAAAGMPEDLVLILAATHTHSGPGAYGSRFLEKIAMGHFDPQVFRELVATITRALLRAREAIAPVRIASASAMTEGLVRNRVEPAGASSPQLTVSGLYRPDANWPFAVLINFSAHPTSLGAWNRLLSADYPGVAASAIERRFPGSIAFFFAGSVADQAPVKAGIGYERSAWIGEALAHKALLLLEGAAPEVPQDVRALQERFPLPPAQVRVGRLLFPRWVGRRLVDEEATLSLVRIGKAAFIGVPCDLAASLGESLKQAAGAQGLDPMVIGFASDYVGYCVPAALYEKKKYESSMAFNGPHAGERIVERLTQMLARIRTPEREDRAVER